MGITVVVRSAGPEKTRLTFDATQRVVIGRGPGSDVRLPDASVSHRHATLRAQGAEFVLVDEGSTNGTFVGGVRIAPNTSRLVRSGDVVRVGRIWLELRMDQSPITRDLAVATRDLALALVAEAIAAAGADATTRVRVVEGVDQGSSLLLPQCEREYLIGRAPHCDLSLTDPDVSREHIRVARLGEGVAVIDMGTKNGTSIGATRLGALERALWRPPQMISIGRSVLSLEEPLSDALARIESSPDEPFEPAGVAAGADSAQRGVEARAGAEVGPADGAGAGSGAALSGRGESGLARPDEGEGAAARGRENRRHGRGARAGSPRWSVTDVVVMTAAVGVLAASLAGLVWLLGG